MFTIPTGLAESAFPSERWPFGMPLQLQPLIHHVLVHLGTVPTLVIHMWYCVESWLIGWEGVIYSSKQFTLCCDPCIYQILNMILLPCMIIMC